MSRSLRTDPRNEKYLWIRTGAREELGDFAGAAEDYAVRSLVPQGA